MADDQVSSSSVGTTLNRISSSRNSMPGVPRSTTRDKPAGLPVEVEAQRQRVEML